MTTTILTYVQLASALLLIVGVLLQQRGEGLGGSIIGTTLEYSTRRGVQKSIYWATVGAAVVFFGSSVARLVLGI
jgi:protein translocase SecG subunit